MQAEPNAFDLLVARFEQLGKVDRAAVLATLSPAERERVAAAIVSHAHDRRGALTMARRAGAQYAAYSPWLADIVRQVEDDGSGVATVSAPTRRAITTAHAALRSDRSEPAESLWSQIRRLGQRLIDGEPRRR